MRTTEYEFSYGIVEFSFNKIESRGKTFCSLKPRLKYILRMTYIIINFQILTNILKKIRTGIMTWLFSLNSCFSLSVLLWSLHKILLCSYWFSRFSLNMYFTCGYLQLAAQQLVLISNHKY